MASDQLALTLLNVQRHEQLYNQAIRDPLTGLFNRRYLEETLEREMRRATRHQYPIGFIMLDIDHFKWFNDTYGHDGGDTLLQKVAQFLQASIRGEDVVCRFGGEEFMLILPGIPLETTVRRAKDLCTDVRRLQVEHNGQYMINVTVSIGVATFPKHGIEPRSIIAAVDRALYRAKAEGRNQVVVANTVANAAVFSPQNSSISLPKPFL